MLFGIFFVIIEAKQLDMKTILRNFFSVLRRFKTASVLNVLGLSIAFVAFMQRVASHYLPSVRAGVCRVFASYRGRMPFECLDR